jgi:predicted nucleic acid-binding protein
LKRADGTDALRAGYIRGDVLEVANALCIGERRQRLQVSDIARFAELLQALPIRVDSLELSRAMGPVLAMARAHRLSSYDACYLELAMREGLPLATQDARLREIATRRRAASN